MSPSSSDGIFHSILVRFYLKNTSPNFEKSLNLYPKNKKHFQLSGCFSIRNLWNAILVPTWLHVGANMGPCWLKKTILARLGPSWALLDGSWGVLGIDPKSDEKMKPNKMIFEAQEGGEAMDAACRGVDPGTP